MDIRGGSILYTHNRKEHSAAFSPAKGNRLPGLEIDCDIRTLNDATHIRVTLRPEGRILLHDLSLEALFPFHPNDRVFCNGYQSWTDSREFRVDESISGLRSVMRIIKMHRYGDSNFFPYSGKTGGMHSHTYTYIRRGTDFTLAGSLSEQWGYTIFRFDTPGGSLKIFKDCDGLQVDRNLAVLEFVIVRGDETSVFSRYFQLAKCTGKSNPITGWTSWYNYYTRISEEIILNNLFSLSEYRIPIDTFQIDDGFQTAVGDWLSLKPEFPNGMKHIAAEIHKQEYMAGLWLAPFICEKKSELAKQHNKWLVADTSGKPVVAGWNPGWSGDFYALDIYNPRVREYIEHVFNTVLREWDYDMVKLDFLYAAAIIPRDGKSRGAIMHDAMVFLRECVKSRKILGCGVPLGSSFGLVDYCRIGGDVALKWEDRLLKFMRYRERVDTLHSLTSTIGRRHLNGNAFINDPDVFILRDENTSLTPEEKISLFILNTIFGGLVFTSDDVSTYSKGTMRLYRSMFPLRGKTIHSSREESGLHTIHFSIGPMSYLAYANLSDGVRSFNLGKGVLFRCVPGTREGRFILGGGYYTLAPHETHCFLRISAKIPFIAGSDAHIFPGSEVSSLKATGKNFTIKLHSSAQKPATVYVRVAKEGTYTINGIKVSSEAVLPEVNILKLTLE